MIIGATLDRRANQDEAQAKMLWRQRNANERSSVAQRTDSGGNKNDQQFQWCKRAWISHHVKVKRKCNPWVLWKRFRRASPASADHAKTRRMRLGTFWHVSWLWEYRCTREALVLIN